MGGNCQGKAQQCLELVINGGMFRNCQVLQWDVVDNSISVNCLFVAEDNELPKKIFCPEFT